MALNASDHHLTLSCRLCLRLQHFYSTTCSRDRIPHFVPAIYASHLDCRVGGIVNNLNSRGVCSGRAYYIDWSACVRVWSKGATGRTSKKPHQAQSQLNLMHYRSPSQAHQVSKNAFHVQLIRSTVNAFPRCEQLICLRLRQGDMCTRRSDVWCGPNPTLTVRAEATSQFPRSRHCFRPQHFGRFRKMSAVRTFLHCSEVELLRRRYRNRLNC